MKDIFKKDISVKIGSVLIAILFWLYVYNTADNPYKTRTFTSVPIKVENEAALADKGLVIKNKYKQNIEITIRGRQGQIDKVRESDFEVILDLARIKSAKDNKLALIGPICNQKDVTIESYSPRDIELVVAQIKDNTFPVQLKPTITLKPSYKILKISQNLEAIRLEGEEALIDSVGSITAAFDIKDLDRDVTKKVECKVFNTDGKEIPALSRNLIVDITIEVAKEVPVILMVNGAPAEDYTEVMRSITPDKVNITGSPEALSKTNEIRTEPVSIENIKQDLNVAGILKIPTGVKLADNAKEVMVNVTVEPLVTKELIIPKDVITLRNASIDSTMNYEVKSDGILLQLKGRTFVLDSLRPQDISPSVDVTGLSEGTNKIPLNITLPQQVKLLNEVQVEVKVTKAPTSGV